jgi:hypothetical protein
MNGPEKTITCFFKSSFEGVSAVSGKFQAEAVFVLNKHDKATRASQGPDYHFNIYVHRRVSIGYRVAPSLVTRGILARPLPMTVLTPGPAPASPSAGGAPFLSLSFLLPRFSALLWIYTRPLFFCFFFFGQQFPKVRNTTGPKVALDPPQPTDE